MKAIAHSGFAPTNNLRMAELARKAGRVLHNLTNALRKMAWLAHREPGFCEQHWLDENLGPEIRRTWW